MTVKQESVHEIQMDQLSKSGIDAEITNGHNSPPLQSSVDKNTTVVTTEAEERVYLKGWRLHVMTFAYVKFCSDGRFIDQIEMLNFFRQGMPQYASLYARNHHH